ncbi:MAG: AAA family ATPase, partial [Cyanobacteria bacterium J06607_13]
KVAQLNIGDLMDKHVGESERKLREALAAFDSVGRIVVFLDEIDKMISGGGGDGGVSKRLVGSLLTWLQEKPAGVFVVATANNLDSILNHFPELLRSGRIDSIFWFDVPSARGRAEILKVHLAKRNVDLTVDALLGCAGHEVFDDFVGADLEQCVMNAAKAAFIAGDQTISIARLIDAAADIKPVARRMKAQLDEQRRWARDNALFASSQEASASRQQEGASTGAML